MPSPADKYTAKLEEPGVEPSTPTTTDQRLVRRRWRAARRVYYIVERVEFCRAILEGRCRRRKSDFLQGLTEPGLCLPAPAW